MIIHYKLVNTQNFIVKLKFFFGNLHK